MKQSFWEYLNARWESRQIIGGCILTLGFIALVLFSVIGFIQSLIEEWETLLIVLGIVVAICVVIFVILFIVAIAKEMAKQRDTETIDETNSTITNGVLVKYNGSKKYITIPDTITAIATRAFDTADIRRVFISGSVKKIEEEAFWGCSELEEVVLEEGVEVISSFAFSFNSALKHAFIPRSVYTIGDCAFFRSEELTIISSKWCAAYRYAVKEKINWKES